MSSYRRRLAAIANKLICGIDFSKQPDNELWYITTDGQKTDNSDKNLMGEFSRQAGLSVVSHTYENGLGKVRYNDTLKVLGGQAFRSTKNTLLVSLPRTLERLGAFCFGDSITHAIGHLILLNKGKVTYNPQLQFKPRLKSNLYVQPNCSQYYKGNFDNIIEKKI